MLNKLLFLNTHLKVLHNVSRMEPMFNLLFRFDNILHATLGTGQHLSFLSLWTDIWRCVQQSLGKEGALQDVFLLTSSS